jgi:hypothetical protein
MKYKDWALSVYKQSINKNLSMCDIAELLIFTLFKNKS